MSHSHTLTEEELFCLRGCRSYGQYYEMHKRFETGRCTFCVVDRELNTIEFENDTWMVWQVPKKFLRKELAYHFMIVPTRHIRYMWELRTREFMALGACYSYLKRNYGEVLTGGIEATRFGDMRLNAGTVPHLHINIMVPNGTSEVRVPVFKTEKDGTANMERMQAFAQQYEAGEIPA